MKRKLYFRNAVLRWKKEVAAAESGVILLSPYITSTTAETVLQDITNPGDCEIYTVFSAFNFINGSSSLKTLKGLLDRGFHLYHLPDLHAKVVVVKGHFVSIGSQNLTTRGSVSLEATCCHEDDNAAFYAEKCIAEWTTKRIPITEEMISDMLALLPSTKKSYAEFMKQANDIDETIRKQEEIRAEKREQKRLVNLEETKKKEKFTQRLNVLKDVSAKLPVSSTEKLCEVKRISQESHSDWDYETHFNTTFSLIPYHRKRNMKLWRTSGGETINLLGYNRYFCLNVDTGVVGWIRVTKTRITFIGNGVSRTEPVLMGPWQCQFSFSSIPNPEAAESNIEIAIETSLPHVCKTKVQGWFGINSLDVRLTNGSQNALEEWIVANREESERILTRMILEPFLYKQRLHGQQANKFFGPVSSSHYLKVVLIQNSPILISRKF